MKNRPLDLNLSNWRMPPHNRWAFHHVREVVPSELIAAPAQASALASNPGSEVGALNFVGADDQRWSLMQWLEASSSDALLVAHRGKLVHEWYRDEDNESHPHIVFSVSKSITAILAGVLVAEGLLDPARPVAEYIPELASSGYSDATLQQVMDMAVCIDFDEDYLATSGKFIEYRTATAWHPCAIEEIDISLHQFLCSIGRAEGTHGEVWQYKSPNSDLLGWVLERVSGERLASLMSSRLWQPMGAEADAYITVDRKGAARTAGGICVLPRDLLRFAELVRNRGYANGQQVIASSWIEECSDGGSREAWERGHSTKEFEDGQYRNKWYQTGNAHRAMLAIGIHSQWVYVDPVAEVSMVKLSSQDTPLKPELDAINIKAFETLCDAF